MEFAQLDWESLVGGITKVIIQLESHTGIDWLHVDIYIRQ